MNWQNLPINTSKLYITAKLTGGCDIFVPIKNNYTPSELSDAKLDLHKFIRDQKLYLLKKERTDGKGCA